MAKLRRRANSKALKLFQVVIKTDPDSDVPNVSVWTIARDVHEANDKVESRFKDYELFNINVIASSEPKADATEVLII